MTSLPATILGHRYMRHAPGFTLVELLAVVTLIVLLAGIVMGLASYTTRRAGVSRAKADLAVLSAACEAFRSDRDRYPTSTSYRLSSTYYWEGRNSALLHEQLLDNGYVAANLLPVQPTKFVSCGAPSNLVHAIMDPWTSPYNYFCTYPRMPTTTWVAADCSELWETPMSAINWCIGGQKDPAYDLFSYGPDKKTYDPGSPYGETRWPAISSTIAGTKPRADYDDLSK